ncbi:MAG: hypothetical protein IJN26_02490 [Bacteroidales bacterium]|nr:hypothetical protein [Bacteroidales bacterium]
MDMIVHQCEYKNSNACEKVAYSDTVHAVDKVFIVLEHPWQYCAICAYMEESMVIISPHPVASILKW